MQLVAATNNDTFYCQFVINHIKPASQPASQQNLYSICFSTTLYAYIQGTYLLANSPGQGRSGPLSNICKALSCKRQTVCIINLAIQLKWSAFPCHRTFIIHPASRSKTLSITCRHSQSGLVFDRVTKCKSLGPTAAALHWSFHKWRYIIARDNDNRNDLDAMGLPNVLFYYFAVYFYFYYFICTLLLQYVAIFDFRNRIKIPYSVLKFSVI